MKLPDAYGRKKNAIEAALTSVVPEGLAPVLRDSMRYSLLGGGKRLRPVLYLSVIEAYGLTPGEEDLKAACAVECLHAYSLIHDDLPAMDNDDFRRGCPTNHKKYGESIALLAGDGLLNLAYELLADAAVADPKFVFVLREIAACAGVTGMVGGQALEFTADLASADAEALRRITRLKTGKLIEGALVGGCISAGKIADTELWRKFAELFGRAFQLCDDLLDSAEGEFSLARLLGRAESRDELTALHASAIRTLGEIECDGAFLRLLSDAMLLRETDGLS